VTQRVHIAIRGAVQGVGFRPFVYRLATEMGLPGWVLNSPQGVFIEVEGEKEQLDSFVLRLESEKPPRAYIQSLEFSFLDPVEYRHFEIRESGTEGSRTALVLPDIATCEDCLREIFDPNNRRYRYPFTNCTNCGPRFTIIEALPYDRPNTSMKRFALCPACRREYEDPADRRFHAQPNACPVCGPKLEFWDEAGDTFASHDDALMQALEQIRAGKIVAVKGLGGFHLMVDARDHGAIARLRERKHREEKPFALMFPTLESICAECEVSAFEERLLTSAESPIVLLVHKQTGRPAAGVADSVAPRNPYLGAMLPYTPLHHLLMRELGFPVVATSGNLSEEPICTDEHEALVRLRGIADGFLVHNRPIVRHVDDSIVRVLLGRELVVRRSRGYAPLPWKLRSSGPEILAVGGHLKNTIAMTVENNVFISQHIGDLENAEATEAFRKVIGSFEAIYGVKPRHVAADMHPEYLSTKFAGDYGSTVVPVQHHYAHVAACMAENELEGRVLGVAWDGTGYGLDGTIWGGEFLLADNVSFQRVGSLREFSLPGSERAIKEPRRTAVGLLYEIYGAKLPDRMAAPVWQAFGSGEIALLMQMLGKGVNSPRTSSAGRLFDAVASITGLRQKMNFEGQAAMELEFSIEPNEEAYPIELKDESAAPNAGRIILDWEPLVRALLKDLGGGVGLGVMAARFHNGLVQAVVSVAERIGQERVVLSGGCFQNKYLTERAVRRLEARGFRPYWHQRVPPNDGGIALGQAAVAARLLERDAST